MVTALLARSPPRLWPAPSVPCPGC